MSITYKLITLDMMLKEYYLPEKKIPSTQAKPTSLSANESELHMGHNEMTDHPLHQLLQSQVKMKLQCSM